MIDGLDIAASVREGERHLRRQRRERVIGAALVVLAMVGAQLFANFALRPTAQLLTFDGANWVDVPLPEGESPYQIFPASDGSLWIGTRSTCGFLRYQNGTWSDCTGGGTNPTFYNAYMPLVATHGDEVWTVRDDSVLRYDGARWISYDNILPNYSASAIEASELGVFITDYYGDLTHFDGSAWTTQPLSAVLPNAPLNTYSGTLGLAKTTDGTIYLSYGGGIYHYDGRQWQLFAPQATFTVNTLYAGTADTLWVYGASGLGTVNVNGKPVFTPRNNGLGGNVGYPNQFLLANGVPTLINYQGIYQWQGTRWQAIPVQPTAGLYQQVLGADSSGALWLISNNYQMYDPYATVRREVGVFARYGWWVIGIGTLMLLSVVQVGVTRRGRAAQRLIWEARFDVPDLVTVQAGGGLYRIWQAIFAMLIGVAVFAFTWGEFREEWGWKLIAALLVLFGLLIPLLLRWRSYVPTRRSMYVEDRPLEISYRLIAALIIGGLLYFFVALLWERLELSPSIGVILYPLFALYFGWLAIMAWKSTYVQSTINLIKMNDDAAVNAQLAWMERWLPLQAKSQVLRADLANLRGDLPEAARLYRRSLYEYQSDPLLAPAILVGYADVLQKQDCYAQSLPLLECAVRIRPEAPYVYRELAQYYQRQNLEPERAATLLKAAEKFGK